MPSPVIAQHLVSRRSTIAAALAVASAATVAASKVDQPTASAATTCTKRVAAVGDIVRASTYWKADAVGRLTRAQNPALVLVLGDAQYESGSASEYSSYYNKSSWGALKPITRPVPGNHDYKTPGAAGYYGYFGKPEWYGFYLGCGWRVHALNSETKIAEQAAWVAKDLAAHPRAKIVTYWHKPRYSSGSAHGSNPELEPLWAAYKGRRTVALAGHEHNYERFAEIGTIRQFVVGTGGAALYGFDTPLPSSRKRLKEHGVLMLKLTGSGSYSWRFQAVDGTTPDSGSDAS